MEIAWGKKVSPAFKREVMRIADELGCDPSHLMAAIAFETGERFTPDVRNPQSGATGLIQFMPATAKGLGTTTDALAAMTAEEQLAYVEKHFSPWAGRMKTLSDVYMTILWPKAVGRPEAHVLFSAPSKRYLQNKGLDANKDGQVTKGEAASKVQQKLAKGLGVAYRG
jgi:hypothetical protein